MPDPCQLHIEANLAIQLSEECDFLLQMEAAHLDEQLVSDAHISLSPTLHFARVAAQDFIGERIWLRAAGQFEVGYRASVSIGRDLADVADLQALAPRFLPDATVPYIFASRFCPSDRLAGLVEDEFGNTEGGNRIAAIVDWIGAHLTYCAGTSTPLTTALDTLADRAGVCRDFAHVLIALARASAIPARYAAVYAPQVEPQDFHAVAEVFLANRDSPGGSWHLVDPTGMAKAGQMARIGIGRDAADVSFFTSFGFASVLEKTITVTPG